MKNIFLALVATLISSFVLTNNVAAQYDLGINEEDMPDLSNPIPINVAANPATDNYLKDINEHATRNFQKKFPGIPNPFWYKVSDGYIASFNENAAETKVAYDKRGRLLHTIKYYQEEKMSRDVRHIVKSTYYDYSIISVAEISINRLDIDTTYVVYIQDPTSLKILTIANYEILRVQDFQRGDVANLK